MHSANGVEDRVSAVGPQSAQGLTAGGTPLVSEMAMGEGDVSARKALLEFGQEDVERVVALNAMAAGYGDEVIEAFYEHLLSFPEGVALFTDPKQLQEVRQMQKDYFLKLTEGQYDQAYVEDRLRMGAVHERIGLPIQTYLGMYNFYLQAVAARIFAEAPGSDERSLASFLSLIKLTFLDMGLAIDTYLMRRERTIRDQEKAVRDLPTPVLRVRDGLLILPVIGVIDAPRARQLTEVLLDSIRENRARVVVMDVTGVLSVDSHTANRLVQTVQASRLMGATVILTGVSPEIAQTLVTIGVDLGSMHTVGDLQGGIEEADRLLGYRIVHTADVSG
jgi:rsbT co-antagonist protein RsbR